MQTHACWLVLSLAKRGQPPPFLLLLAPRLFRSGKRRKRVGGENPNALYSVLTLHCWDGWKGSEDRKKKPAGCRGKQELTASWCACVFLVFFAISCLKHLTRAGSFWKSCGLFKIAPSCLFPSIPALNPGQGSGLLGFHTQSFFLTIHIYSVSAVLWGQSLCFGNSCGVVFTARLSKLKGSDVEGLGCCKVMYIFTVTELWDIPPCAFSRHQTSSGADLICV